MVGIVPKFRIFSALQPNMVSVFRYRIAVELSKSYSPRAGTSMHGRVEFTQFYNVLRGRILAALGAL